MNGMMQDRLDGLYVHIFGYLIYEYILVGQALRGSRSRQLQSRRGVTASGWDEI